MAIFRLCKIHHLVADAKEECGLCVLRLVMWWNCCFLVLIWQKCSLFSLHPLLLLYIVLPRQSGTVCLAMSFLVDVVFVADVACSLLWGKDTIGSMPGSHRVVLPSGETTSRLLLQSYLNQQKDIVLYFKKANKMKFAIPNWASWRQWCYAVLSYNCYDSGKIEALTSVYFTCKVSLILLYSGSEYHWHSSVSLPVF